MISRRRCWVLGFFLFLAVASRLEAAVDYQVKASIVYVEKTDTLRFMLWLEYRGVMVTNATRASNVLGNAQVYISDTASGGWLEPLTIKPPTVGGVYSLDIADITTKATPQLKKGATYFARCVVNYGGTSGTEDTFQTVTTFTISITQSLVVVTRNILGLNQNIHSQVSGLKPMVTNETATLRQSVDEVKTQTQKIVTATQKTLPDQIRTATERVQAGVRTAAKSEIISRETTAVHGETVNVRYRTYEAAAPLITVYDPGNVSRIWGARMSSVSPGIYEYPVTFSTEWPTGEYTIVCSEPSYDTMDAVTMTIVSKDIENISDDVGAILDNVGSAPDVNNKISAFSAALRIIEENINRAARELAVAEPGSGAAAHVADQLASLYNSLNDMSAKIAGLGNTAGLDVEKLYAMDASRSADWMYLRDKTQELKALLMVNQQMMQDTAREYPIIQTWMIFR